MCDSRLRRVVATDALRARVAAPDGHEEQVSLVAYEDAPLVPGDYVVVHSGFALMKATPEDAQAVLAELARAGIGGRAATPSADKEAR